MPGLSPTVFGTVRKAAQVGPREGLHRPFKQLGASEQASEAWETRIDNNLVENAIRPSVIGNRKYLLIGHRSAWQRAAIIYSIVVSCQRGKIHPLACLRDVLSRLPATSTKDDLGALAPANYKPA